MSIPFTSLVGFLKQTNERTPDVIDGLKYGGKPVIKTLMEMPGIYAIETVKCYFPVLWH